VPSQALRDWTSDRAARLDRLLSAHSALTGHGPGRRWITVEVNHALIVRLAGEFQGFARDLHDEAIDAFVAGIPASHASVIRAALQRSRKLDSGNATWANIGNDFAVFGLSLATELSATYPYKYPKWTACLNNLNDSRNAIAHQDPSKLALMTARHGLTLHTFKAWRTTLSGVASALDRATGRYLRSLNGVAPW
jgi:hypothetical protein